MRIAHICLAGAFSEGMSYQDNLLVEINRQDGHDVLVVSDCMRFEGGLLVPSAPEDRVLTNGARLVRLPFDWSGPTWLTNKIKRCNRLYPLLEDYRPDIILYHGVIGWGLLILERYKQAYPEAKIYLDSHEDVHNSGTNFLSYQIQYRLLTRTLIHRILPVIDKIFYVSLEVRDWLTEVLDLPADVLEYYPLGGLVIADAERVARRRQWRQRFGIADDRIVFLHTGKIDPLKKSDQTLRAFSAQPHDNAFLIIAGSIEAGMATTLNDMIAADSRIQFIGWQGPSALIDAMCGSDIYVQPGGQSASLQHAICCGMPIIIHPYSSHQPFLDGNGFFVKTADDIGDAMRRIVADPASIDSMRTASYRIARDLLDYRTLAARLYV